VQQAWAAESVSQCGFCQPGMIMAAAALVERSDSPTDAEIDGALGNLCRCGTYPRIREAVRRAIRARTGQSRSPARRRRTSPPRTPPAPRRPSARSPAAAAPRADSQVCARRSGSFSSASAHPSRRTSRLIERVCRLE
jgi:isoquinoline 1-oxidoreductase alpha subunit